MIGEASNCRETISGTPNTHCATSPGSPASWKQRSTSTADPAVSSLGLMMIEQPAASAGAILRTTFMIGKFHAQNAATGPTGWCSTRLREPGARGSTRP